MPPTVLTAHALKNKADRKSAEIFGQTEELKARKKKRQSSDENCRFLLAAELGFEPRQTESESAVLPLHNSAMALSTESLTIIYYSLLNVKPFFALFLKK